MNEKCHLKWQEVKTELIKKRRNLRRLRYLKIEYPAYHHLYDHLNQS